PQYPQTLSVLIAPVPASSLETPIEKHRSFCPVAAVCKYLHLRPVYPPVLSFVFPYTGMSAGSFPITLNCEAPENPSLTDRWIRGHSWHIVSNTYHGPLR